MTEDFLHFIWKFGLFDRNAMVADTGDAIQVLTLGEHNTDAGPDFLNSRINISNTIWAGNVEIHLRSSDWFSHKHQHDRSFDNVILHVVYRYDQPVKRLTGEIIPTVELRFDQSLFENYCELLQHKEGLPCNAKVAQVDPLIIGLWLNALVAERLQQKTRMLEVLLNQYKNNWEEAFYITLARAFGFGLNALPFELLAKSVPLSALARHRNNPGQVEALLLGQAGFLQEPVLFSDYHSMLRKEYQHLKNKYSLNPVGRHVWKFLRLRPANFPTVRIAQFAALMRVNEGMFSRVLLCSDVNELRSLFDIAASEFWNTHYSFEALSPVTVKTLGHDAINIIIINAVVPFLFQYGKMTGHEEYSERALSWLSRLPAERNRVTRRMSLYGIQAASAADSQGIIQLANRYCNRKQCLACSIGGQIIRLR